jgi:two-component sensor histidine kinase
LIEALAEQLAASVDVDRSRGTRVELAFGSNKPNAAEPESRKVGTGDER